MLAINRRAPRGTCQPALSLTTIASKLAPTVCSIPDSRIDLITLALQTAAVGRRSVRFRGLRIRSTLLTLARTTDNHTGRGGFLGAVLADVLFHITVDTIIIRIVLITAHTRRHGAGSSPHCRPFDPPARWCRRRRCSLTVGDALAFGHIRLRLLRTLPFHRHHRLRPSRGT